MWSQNLFYLLLRTWNFQHLIVMINVSIYKKIKDSILKKNDIFEIL